MSREHESEAREQGKETGSEPTSHESETSQESRSNLSRRSFLRWGALAGAGTASARELLGRNAEAMQQVAVSEGIGVRGLTIAELQGLMESGETTSRELVASFTRRIERFDHDGPRVNSVIELNPQARGIARYLDNERRTSGPRGPLHGIPILLKDNIDTGDRMQTAAGSLALVGTPALQDSTVAKRLRAAGAVILGKAGLSEWANFRGFDSSSGWSGRGGQVRNPYITSHNPCGSSSGSAAATSASFCAAALGTETDGSIVCPSSSCGVVGIKPTVGLTSRAGVVPISAAQDTVGPHGRTVADAAAVLGALTGNDPRDPATAGSIGRFHRDYTQFVDPDGLNGARIGVARELTGFTAETDQVFEDALAAMQDAGAEVVDPAFFPNFNEFASDPAEIIVLVWEFKRDLNAYLQTRVGVPVGDMQDVIDFNRANADQELPFFGQEWFELSQAEIFSEQEYMEAIERGPRLAGPEGIDALMADLDLDAIVAPTGTPAWPIDLVNGDCFRGGSSSYAAVAGYPLISVPAGSSFGLPVGITFMGGAYSEPALIRIASGFEYVTQARSEPRFRFEMPALGDQGPRSHSRAQALEAPGRQKHRTERSLENLVRELRGHRRRRAYFL